MNNDEKWMEQAIVLAKQAVQANEVPVGAVLVLNDEIIGKGYNQPVRLSDPTAHAEIIALREAALKLNNYRLPEACLYVTVEPCLMCLGAILQARIKTIVFGATALKYGALTLDKVNQQPGFKKIVLKSGVLKEECVNLLRTFFKKRR